MIELANFEELTADAIATFWNTRGSARAKQESGVDVGHRSAVTAGKNMDGFARMFSAIAKANGLPGNSIYCGTGETVEQRHTTLPGYYRPSKTWDFLVVHNDNLVAALEFKSHVGPSFGNNYNNRTEEALGMGEDTRAAFEENLIGPAPRPFLGYLMLLEDVEESRTPTRISSKHFDYDPSFRAGSYADRYHVLCDRLMKNQLYDSACLLLSSAEEGLNGDFRVLSRETGIRRMVAGFAASVAEVIKGD